MLKDQTDYSIPEKQQELRSFVGELDNTAFKDCNGSEVMITLHRSHDVQHGRLD